jgi:hypothetical protein
MSQSGKKNITETIEGAGYLRDALLVGILPHPLTPSRKAGHYTHIAPGALRREWALGNVISISKDGIHFCRSI